MNNSLDEHRYFIKFKSADGLVLYESCIVRPPMKLYRACNMPLVLAVAEENLVPKTPTKREYEFTRLYIHPPTGNIVLEYRERLYEV